MDYESPGAHQRVPYVSVNDSVSQVGKKQGQNLRYGGIKSTVYSTAASKTGAVGAPVPHQMSGKEWLM